MNKAIIIQIEDKEPSGIKMWKCNVELDGRPESGVAFWKNDWPTLVEGQEVMGDYKVVQKGNYTNKNFYPPRDGYTPVRPKVAPTRSFKPSANLIAVAQDRKEQSIAKSQHIREETDKTRATMEGAVKIAIALWTNEFDGDPRKTMAREIEFWRKHLVERWDINEGGAISSTE